MKWFVLPYAYGIANDKSGLPDTEARCRCDAALEAAGSLPNAVVVLSAGMADRTVKLGVPHLAAASEKYLNLKGWPSAKMLINPKGKDTVTETDAALEAIGNLDSTVVASTTWYHAFRVWLVWLLHGRMVRLRVSWHTASRLNVLRELPAILKSLLQVLWRKTLKSN